MVCEFDSRLSGQGSSAGGDIVLCSWARHLTLTVPLSTQVYKWVTANLMLRLNLQWTSIPSQGEQKYSQLLDATETGISSSLMGCLGSYADFTITFTISTFLAYYLFRQLILLINISSEACSAKFTITMSYPTRTGLAQLFRTCKLHHHNKVTSLEYVISGLFLFAGAQNECETHISEQNWLKLQRHWCQSRSPRTLLVYYLSRQSIW